MTILHVNTSLPVFLALVCGCVVCVFLSFDVFCSALVIVEVNTLIYTPALFKTVQC